MMPMHGMMAALRHPSTWYLIRTGVSKNLAPKTNMTSRNTLASAIATARTTTFCTGKWVIANQSDFAASGMPSPLHTRSKPGCSGWTASAAPCSSASGTLKRSCAVSPEGGFIVFMLPTRDYHSPPSCTSGGASKRRGKLRARSIDTHDQTHKMYHCYSIFPAGKISVAFHCPRAVHTSTQLAPVSQPTVIHIVTAYYATWAIHLRSVARLICMHSCVDSVPVGGSSSPARQCTCGHVANLYPPTLHLQLCQIASMTNLSSICPWLSSCACV